jgi:hypothetical protein
MAEHELAWPQITLDLLCIRIESAALSLLQSRFESSRKVSGLPEGLPEKPRGLYSRGPSSALHTKPLNRAGWTMARRVSYLAGSSNVGNSFMLKFDTTTTAAPSGAIAG